ncbi:hypothetical protein H3147_01815 [Streptomyces sp. OF8]|uniref:Hydrogenase expression protein HypF n=2 Tax=Streptomyces alkaliterrae TaxID=2213162 RepID=A0A5P0YR99_9ACTN|nr:hypothetical protein [Streptomyces alkaliterrae]MQS02795.1 hypothetical protein [Streptomyces alkaliterrae]
MAGEARERRGPRHAAPRKPLLTRLQVPGGRAAMAVMPSALLLGIGLSPNVAGAQPGGRENPFQAGPCVSAPDRAGADSEAEEKPDERPESGPTPAPERSTAPPTAAPPAASTPSATPRPSVAPRPSASPRPSGTGEARPEPEATDTRNPLDPLDVGGRLRDLLGLGDKDSTPTPEPSATPTTPSPPPTNTPTEEAPAPKEPMPGGAPERSAPDRVAEPAPTARPEKPPTRVDPTEDDTAEDGGPDQDDEAQEDARSEPGGKEPFPCPEFDAEAYDNAAYERTPAALPDVPFHLKTSRLGLSGLKYHGIVLVRTHGGQEKRVLKFTAEELNIRDLHQYAPTSAGRVQHIRSRPGSTSTFRGGTVTMYTEELKGWLFGLIPITFSPKSPPPLDLPAAFFTSAEVRQAGQFGGNLTVPGLRLSLE